MTMELQVQVLRMEMPVVEFNTDEISNYLDNLLTKYDGLVFTDESAKECKSTIAELNKMAKSISTFRIEKKKELLAPVDLFEAQCKQLAAKIENVIEPLKMQADAFEERRKQEKRTQVEEWVKEALLVVPLEQKYADRVEIKSEYLNATATAPKVKTDIMAQIKSLESEQKSYYDKIEIIHTKCELFTLRLGLQVELVPDMFMHLVDTHDGATIESMIKAQAEKQQLAEQAAIERIRLQAEAKAKVEAEAAAQVEIDKVKAESAQQIETISAAVEAIQEFVPVAAEVEEKRMTATIRITATKSQMDALKAYMEASGIGYERV